jgi:hypothetical protein
LPVVKSHVPRLIQSGAQSIEQSSFVEPFLQAHFPVVKSQYLFIAQASVHGIEPVEQSFPALPVSHVQNEFVHVP